MRKTGITLLSILLLLQLSACQSTKSNSRVIAGVFNASTQIQKSLLIDMHLSIYRSITTFPICIHQSLRLIYINPLT